MSIAALANINEFDRAPGDFGLNPLGLLPKDRAKADEVRLKELQNGRLAMIAAGGVVAGAQVSGHGFPYV